MAKKMTTKPQKIRKVLRAKPSTNPRLNKRFKDSRKLKLKRTPPNFILKGTPILKNKKVKLYKKARMRKLAMRTPTSKHPIGLSKKI